MTKARITIGEHWPVLNVSRVSSTFGTDTDRAVYQVDAKTLGDYGRALKTLQLAEAALIEGIKPSYDGPIEPELLDYLQKLREME